MYYIIKKKKITSTHYLKSSYAKNIKIITIHNQSLFHYLVARKIPKQQQQSNQNNIHSSNPNAKTHKK